MSKKYHVSTLTGLPGVCRAKEGNCPYGGKSGRENHYDTFSEAQRAAQEMSKNKHGILPINNPDALKPKSAEEEKEVTRGIRKLFASLKSTKETEDDIPEVDIDSVLEEMETDIRDKQFNEDSLISEDEWKYVADLYDSIQKSATSTRNLAENMEYITDSYLLEQTISRNDLLKEDEHVLSAALQNPHLRMEYIEDVLKSDDLEKKRLIVMNPALSHERIIEIAEDTNEDIAVRTLALKNMSIEEDYAVDFVNRRPDDLLKAPWVGLLNNSKFTLNENYESGVLSEYLGKLDDSIKLGSTQVGDSTFGEVVGNNKQWYKS